MKKAFSTQRRNMIDCQIKPFSVTDVAILAAFDTVPREQYAPIEKAYADENIVLEDGRLLIEPASYARLLQEADIKPGEAVREIGASGYSTAILKELNAKIVSEGACDLLIINGAVEQIPDAISVSVNEGGRLATFVRKGGRSYAAIYQKQDGVLIETPIFEAAVPVLAGFEAKPGFVF